MKTSQIIKILFISSIPVILLFVISTIPIPKILPNPQWKTISEKTNRNATYTAKIITEDGNAITSAEIEVEIFPTGNPQKKETVFTARKYNIAGSEVQINWISSDTLQIILDSIIGVENNLASSFNKKVIIMYKLAGP